MKLIFNIPKVVFYGILLSLNVLFLIQFTEYFTGYWPQFFLFFFTPILFFTLIWCLVYYYEHRKSYEYLLFSIFGFICLFGNLYASSSFLYYNPHPESEIVKIVTILSSIAIQMFPLIPVNVLVILWFQNVKGQIRPLFGFWTKFLMAGLLVYPGFFLLALFEKLILIISK